MRKIHFILLCVGLVLGCLLLAAIIILRPWSSKIHTITMTTEVKVREGLPLNLYRINEMNRPIFIRTVEPGQSAEVTVKRRVYDNGGVFEFLNPLMSIGMRSIIFEVAQLTRGKPAGDYHLAVKEGDFNQHIAEAFLHQGLPLSNVAVRVNEDGIQFGAHFKHGLVDIPINAKAVVSLDWQGRIFLNIYETRVGPIEVPGFMLRQLENVFYNSGINEGMNLKILDISYQDSKILINCRKT